MKERECSPLQRVNMDADPIKQFAQWFQEAEQAELPLPNAMTLATSTRAGKPSARIVLLKEVGERGFVFYTNHESRKGHELSENLFAALVFCWLPLSRQVRVEGAVEHLEAGESELYFAGRPRGSQIEAHASPQSQVVKDRFFLDQQFKDVTEKFAGQEVPCPENWGGYRVVPDSLEFWQAGEHRLHDRLRYRRDSAGHWVIDRLAP